MATAAWPPERLDLGDVVLRIPRLDDAEALHRATTIDLDHLAPWLGWATPEGNTVDQRRAFIEERRAAWPGEPTYLILAVVVGGGDGEVLGVVGFHDRIGPGGLEVGYWLATAAGGSGIMTRAVGALADAALATDGIDRIEVRCDESNVRSAGVARRLGFALARTMDAEVTAPAETGHVQVWARTAADGPCVPTAGAP